MAFDWSATGQPREARDQPLDADPDPDPDGAAR